MPRSGLASTTAARASQNSAIVVAQARRPATSSAASQYLALSLIAFITVGKNLSALANLAGSWTKPRRVIAKVEWHPGELYPRVGFIVTNMARPVVAFYNKRGTCEQWMKEGKGALKWRRLSCRSFTANAVWLQLHALAYNLGNFLHTLTTPEPIQDWSLTSLKEKLIKIGRSSATAATSPSRWPRFSVPRNLFADILRLIGNLRAPLVTSTG